MKHGTRFWEKKLNRTPAHRRALLRNLLTQLVYHERIQTTVAKAKYMKRAADKLIEWAKAGDQESLKKAKALLFVPHITVSKLQGPLTARYASRKGGYTRIHLNGFRSNASDRAPLAIVEFVDNPRDIVHGLARQHVSTIRTRLQELESRLYAREVIPIRDPVTGMPGEVVKLKDRHNLPGREKMKLARQELGLMKMLQKMERSLESWPRAREVEAEHARTAREQREARDQPLVEVMQQKLDEALSSGDGRLSWAFRRALRRGRYVVDQDGKVSRAPSAAEEAFEGIVVEAGAGEHALAHTDTVAIPEIDTLTSKDTTRETQDGQSVKEGDQEVSTLGRLFGKFGLGSKK
ncbi:ribosomal protein L17 [Spizellomyces punctatus DAOM BR117]|uniref:Ribosomal protein L17 n=1 Tax=Spizellomyces punctatus (strain DAOM BR117) TaxID=645134 RepID=A0A0L0HVT0_SPIPD|nr:ribosomal protein L17 [Spizellomyces punctatus DAOM BR117]KND04984.1 ribosomal protein L17 [Spizellomyces punctatus DAOM BR117]|eukprot:XP_016613023.1 ribosomal protein L17 [Spizellomyces punctatus DAOM BR117]